MSFSFATPGTNHSGGTSLSLTYSASPTNLDLWITCFTQRSGSSSSITTASGWTHGTRTNEATGIATDWFYRISDGTESGSVSWTCTAGADIVGAVFWARGLDTTATLPFVQAGGTGNVGTTSIVAPTATVAVGDLILRLYSTRIESATVITFSGYDSGAATELVDTARSGASNPNFSLGVAYETAASTTAGTRTATASSSATEWSAKTISFTALATASSSEARRHMPRGVNRGVLRGVGAG